MGTEAVIAVVDLGGTRVRAALARPPAAADPAGCLGTVLRADTDPRGGRAVARQVADLCRRAAAADGVPPDRIRVAALGVPGVPDPDTGRIRMAPNIDGLAALDLRAAVGDELGCPVRLENDVNVALLGECRGGDHRGARDLVYVKLGTGIGAGILSHGRLVRGARGGGGQISAVPIGADPEAAESLRAGALERATAGAGIRARYRRLSGEDRAVAEIFDRARAGEAAAARTLDEAAGFLARALGAACALLDPELVLLGGSIGRRRGMLERVDTALRRIHPAPAPVRAETAGLEAALLGCAVLGAEHLAGEHLAGEPRATPGPG